MNFKSYESKIKNLDNIVVITSYENEKFETPFKQINLLIEGFEGKYNKIEIIKAFIDEKLHTVCLVGLGENLKLTSEKARVVGGNLAKKLKELVNEDNCKSKDIDLLNIVLSE